jgi:surfeit locus 1 family protein
MPIFTFTLGTWQLQRLQWKVDLIDELREKLEREPIVLPRQVKYDKNEYIQLVTWLISVYSLGAIPEFIFRKVVLKGKWDHEHTMLLGPRVREGKQGYHVITPLVRTDGSTVLVDRGFVSKDVINKGAFGRDGAEVEVLGMLRTSQSRNSFTPNNNSQKGEWYWADVDAMSEFAGGERAGVQPVFIEEIFGEFNRSTFPS